MSPALIVVGVVRRKLHGFSPRNWCNLRRTGVEPLLLDWDPPDDALPDAQGAPRCW